MEIIELYKEILKDVGMKADDEGFVSLSLGGPVDEPVLIEGKRLVLPTRVQLSTTNIGNRVVFHPLHENLLRGESQVMTSVRETANARINIAFGTIAMSLLVLATSPSQQMHLSPDQTLFMDNLKAVDEDIIEVFNKILTTIMSSDGSKRFVRMFIKRNGRINNERTVQRLTVVTFPLYEELTRTIEKGSPNTVYGVRVTKAQRETLISLMEYMIPNLNVADHYNRGSDSTVAPTLDAVLRAMAALGEVINATLELFGPELIEECKTMMYSFGWKEDFEDLRKLQIKINMIPSQPGNEGKLPVAARPSVEVPEVKVTPAQQSTTTPPWEDEKPAVAPAPAPKSGSIFQKPDVTLPPRHVAPIAQMPQHPGYQSNAYNPGYGVQQQMHGKLPGEGYPGGHVPGAPIQSENQYRPNYVPPGQGAIGVQMRPGMGGYGGAMMQQGPRPAAWDVGVAPGYGYNNRPGTIDFTRM